MSTEQIFTFPGSAHIIGKCRDCGKEHNGRIVLGLTPRGDGIWIEAGVIEGRMFHPLENLSLNEALEKMGIK